MKKWEFLDHTADFGFRIFGRSHKELFFNAKTALIESMLGKQSENAIISSGKLCRIRLISLDRETLLVDWLRKLLELITLENLIPVSILSFNLQSTILKAHIECGRISDDLLFQTEIKAITYHNVGIKQVSGIYSSDIICDI